MLWRLLVDKPHTFDFVAEGAGLVLIQNNVLWHWLGGKLLGGNSGSRRGSCHCRHGRGQCHGVFVGGPPAALVSTSSSFPAST